MIGHVNNTQLKTGSLSLLSAPLATQLRVAVSASRYGEIRMILPLLAFDGLSRLSYECYEQVKVHAMGEAARQVEGGADASSGWQSPPELGLSLPGISLAEH